MKDLKDGAETDSNIVDTKDTFPIDKNPPKNLSQFLKSNQLFKRPLIIISLVLLPILLFFTLFAVRKSQDLRSRADVYAGTPCPQNLPRCVTDDICLNGLNLPNCADYPSGPITGNCCKAQTSPSPSATPLFVNCPPDYPTCINHETCSFGVKLGTCFQEGVIPGNCCINTSSPTPSPRLPTPSPAPLCTSPDYCWNNTPCGINYYEEGVGGGVCQYNRCCRRTYSSPQASAVFGGDPTPFPVPTSSPRPRCYEGRSCDFDPTCCEEVGLKCTQTTDFRHVCTKNTVSWPCAVTGASCFYIYQKVNCCVESNTCSLFTLNNCR